MLFKGPATFDVVLVLGLGCIACSSDGYSWLL